MKHRKAGASTRDMEFRRYLTRAGLCLVGLLVVYGYLKILPTHTTWNTVPLVVVLIIGLKFFESVLLRKIDHVHKREKDAGRGAKAEEQVGEILESLDQEHFKVFHDVVLGYGNIDHIVLRRDGAVFVVETKSHSGKISHDGSNLLRNGRPLEKDFVRQTLGNALTLGKHLGAYAQRQVWVTGILCFTRGFVQVRGAIKGVQVINVKWLSNSIESGSSNAELSDWLWEHFETLLHCPVDGADNIGR